MLLTGKESPSEDRAAHSGTLGDDFTMADGATGPAQRITKDGEEDDWCDDTLEGEEVLNLGVRNTEERKLEQEIEHKSDHSCSGDTLVERDVIGDSGKARPDGCEQNSHTLTTSRGLDTMSS